jgi:hypothetical protein
VLETAAVRADKCYLEIYCNSKSNGVNSCGVLHTYPCTPRGSIAQKSGHQNNEGVTSPSFIVLTMTRVNYWWTRGLNWTLGYNMSPPTPQNTWDGIGFPVCVFRIAAVVQWISARAITNCWSINITLVNKEIYLPFTWNKFFFVAGATAQQWPGPPLAWDCYVTHNDTPQWVRLLWTSDRPVAETSTWQTHNTHKRQTSMPPAGFKPELPVSDRPQTLALDRSATGIGEWVLIYLSINTV